MELEILKKKLSSFKGEGGRIRGVSDNLLLEVLAAWETWAGTSKQFYKGIGSSQTVNRLSSPSFQSLYSCHIRVIQLTGGFIWI